MTNEAPTVDEAFDYLCGETRHFTTLNVKHAGEELRAHIAALEAENKRLIESIVRSRRFIHGGLIVDTAFAKHIQLEDAAEILDSALAQTGEK